MRQGYIRSDMKLMDKFKRSLPSNKSYNWLASLGSIVASIGLIFCILVIAIFATASFWGRGGSAKLEVAVWLGVSILTP
jgi:hypothetical protein